MLAAQLPQALHPPSGGRHVVVPMAGALVTNRPGDLLVTYALGSCLGITIWDPIEKVGGLLHVMLPDSSTSPEKAAGNPDMFIDTGVPRLFREAYTLGAVKQRLLVYVAGGAALGALSDSSFNIGQRNITMLRKILWKNGVLIRAQQVGGDFPRTMALSVDTGEVLLKTDHGISRLSVEA